MASFQQQTNVAGMFCSVKTSSEKGQEEQESEDSEELADLRAALLSFRYLNMRTHVRKKRSMHDEMS